MLSILAPVSLALFGLVLLPLPTLKLVASAVGLLGLPSLLAGELLRRLLLVL